MRFDRWTLRVTFHYRDAEKGDKLSQEERDLLRDITAVFCFFFFDSCFFFLYSSIIVIITVYYSW